MTTFTSKVVAGHGVGQTLGYPTLNFEIPTDLRLATGVYVCEVKMNPPAHPTKQSSPPTSGKEWSKGVLFYGPRTTFGDEQDSLEVHLFCFPTDWQLEETTVKVGTKIRKPRKYENKDELIVQIKKDCVEAHRLLK